VLTGGGFSTSAQLGIGGTKGRGGAWRSGGARRHRGRAAPWSEAAVHGKALAEEEEARHLTLRLGSRMSGGGGHARGGSSPDT
jgi:hypothetical protein